MAELRVRNLDEETHVKLKIEAIRRGITLEKLVDEILKDAARYI